MSLAVYQATVVCLGAVLAVLAALTFSGRIVLPRPAIGTFNGRDVLVLFALIVILPVLYLAVPHAVLTGFLCVGAAVVVFEGIAPIALPAMFAALNADGGFVIPVQAFFGPVAFLVYLWFARRDAVPRPGRTATDPALAFTQHAG